MKTETQLQKDIYEELKWDIRVSEQDIGVSVKNNIASLSGTVPTYAEKIAACDAAKRVNGVAAVVDNITVKLSEQAYKDDRDIAKAAVEALKWHVWVPAADIKVKVHQGLVTLSGMVNYEFQRSAAESAVRYLEGVTGLVNMIDLKPRVNTKDVTQEIEKALLRTAKKEAHRIHVSFEKDGEVKLTGVVRSFAEKTDAGIAAWSAPGVNRVSNEIAVVND